MVVDYRKITSLVETPELLIPFLEGMSNSAFRSASLVLGEKILPSCAIVHFWQTFRALFLHDRKAYLGTLLKALLKRIGADTACVGSEHVEQVGLWDKEFVSVCNELTDTDRKKVLLALLPLFAHPRDAERLLVQCGLKERSVWIAYLLQVQTLPCAYLLLKAMRYVEHDKALLIRTCHFLMKRGDEHSFNLASIMRLSFGLDEVRGTFSLSLQPYQLARIEQSYEAFLVTMRC